MIDPKDVWEPADQPASGAQEAALKQLEKRLSVRLPKLLRAALKVRNGGQVQEDDILLYAAGEPGDGMIESAARLYAGEADTLEMIAEEIGPPEQVVVIGSTIDGHNTFALNYNGEEGLEAEVVLLDTCCGHCDFLNITFEEFLEQALIAEDEPLVRWEDSEEFALLSEQTVAFEDEQVGTVTLQQRLCESVASYVIFVKESCQGQEILTRCEIMQPLNAFQCIITESPDEGSQGFQLTLAPQDEEIDVADEDRDDYESASIEWEESRPRRDGRWKNSYSSGSPGYFAFQSSSRESLEELRSKLIGREVPDEVQACEELNRKLDTMSQADLEAALPAVMLGMFEQALQQSPAGDPETMPAEMADALKELEAFKAQLQNQISQSGGQTDSIDPELKKLVDRMVHPDQTDPNSKRKS